MIHQITRLRSESTSITRKGELAATQLGLAAKVKSLQQHLSSNHQEIESSAESQAVLTAELYRLATLLYLYAVCPDLVDSMERGHWLHQALDVLQKITACTSPWPLFIVAGEVTTDLQRVLILDVLEEMDESRNIGNTFMVRRLIEAYWKQLDLRGYEGKSLKRPRIWDSFNTGAACPWFI